VISIPFRIKQHKVYRSREGEGERERVEKQQECLTIGLDREDLAVIGSLVKFCARAAMGGERVEQWRRRWSFPSLAVPP
jgi:hypothetical protein